MNKKLSFLVLIILLAGTNASLTFGQNGAGAPAAFGNGEYHLGPEDVVDVFVWKEPDLTTSVVVRPDGKISLPLTGELEASGRTAEQIQDAVRARLTEYIADPVVTVIVKEVNNPKISVLGEVQRPDVFKIKHRITALDAIALAGGFTEFANRDEVIVIRDGAEGKQRFELNVERMIDKKGGEVFYLQPMDVVYVK